MLNIADFGGFSGIAKMIQQVKDTGTKLNELATQSGISEITDFKMKYIDALDAFRPGNTQGVASVAGDYEADYATLLITVQSKITDQTQLKKITLGLGECNETITRLLGVVMNALKKAS